MSSADDTFEAVEEQAVHRTGAGWSWGGYQKNPLHNKGAIWIYPPGLEKRTSWKSFFFFFRKFFCLWKGKLSFFLGGEWVVFNFLKCFFVQGWGVRGEEDFQVLPHGLERGRHAVGTQTRGHCQSRRGWDPFGKFSKVSLQGWVDEHFIFFGWERNVYPYFTGT